MENIITNPGLQHLAEKILWNLDVGHLKICGLINQSCQQILDNPMFWLRKFEHLSKANQTDWIKVIQSETNSEKKKYIAAYLYWNLKKKNSFDLPCFTKPDVQEDFRKKIQKICDQKGPSNDNTEDIKNSIDCYNYTLLGLSIFFFFVNIIFWKRIL